MKIKTNKTIFFTNAENFNSYVQICNNWLFFGYFN